MKLRNAGMNQWVDHIIGKMQRCAQPCGTTLRQYRPHCQRARSSNRRIDRLSRDLAADTIYPCSVHRASTWSNMKQDQITTVRKTIPGLTNTSCSTRRAVASATAIFRTPSQSSGHVPPLYDRNKNDSVSGGVNGQPYATANGPADD